MSARRKTRGCVVASASVQPVSDAAVHARMSASPNEPNWPTNSKFLSSAAEPDRIVPVQRCAKISEGLMQIQIVAVGGARAAGTEIFKRTLQLAEYAKVGCGVEIGVEQIALEQKTVVVRRFLIEYR